MRGTKTEVVEILHALPDDCPLEDIEHALLVRYAIQQVEATGEDCVLPYERRLGYHPEMLEGSAKDEVREVLDLLGIYWTIPAASRTCTTRSTSGKASARENGRCRTNGPTRTKRSWSPCPAG